MFRVLLAVMAVLWGGVTSAQQFVVQNRMPQKFEVTVKTPARPGSGQLWTTRPGDAAVRVTPTVEVGNAPGFSGTVVGSAEGKSIVVTCAHGVVPGMAFSAWKDGTQYKGRVAVVDTHRDVAVIEVIGVLPAVKVAKADPHPGEPVEMWGVGSSGLTPTRKTGTASGKAVWRGPAGDPVNGLLMTRTTVQSVPGDSGAGVFNREGRLVGVNSGGVGGSEMATPVADVWAVLTAASGGAATPFGGCPGCQCGPDCQCQQGQECGCLTSGVHATTRATTVQTAGTLPLPGQVRGYNTAQVQYPAPTYTLAPSAGRAGITAGSGCANGRCGTIQYSQPFGGFFVGGCANGKCAR